MEVIEKSIFTENGNIDFFGLLQLLEEERFNYIIPKKLLKQIIGNKDFLTRINPLFKSAVFTSPNNSLTIDNSYVSFLK